MAHFHWVCHENCALKYVGGVLELRKLNFSGLKCQCLKWQCLKGKFDFKRPGYLRPTLASRINDKWPVWYQIGFWYPKSFLWDLEPLQNTLRYKPYGINNVNGLLMSSRSQNRPQMVILAFWAPKIGLFYQNGFWDPPKSNFLSSRTPPTYLRAQFSWHKLWKWVIDGF